VVDAGSCFPAPTGAKYIYMHLNERAQRKGRTRFLKFLETMDNYFCQLTPVPAFRQTAPNGAKNIFMHLNGRAHTVKAGTRFRARRGRLEPAFLCSRPLPVTYVGTQF
jgi:hypothetical protein